MDYIDAEEFLKQPKEVQRVFMDWWKPELGDLVYPDYRISQTNFLNITTKYEDGFFQVRIGSNLWFEKERAIPLFTEGQLRKFIEDKTNGYITTDLSPDGYAINIVNFDSEGFYVEGEQYKTDKWDLLQSYWEIACKIAKQEIEKEGR